MFTRINIRTLYIPVFICVWLILMVALLDISPLGRSKNEWKTSTHEQYNFSFEYPTKWRVLKYGDEGFKNEDEIKAILHYSWIDDFNIEIRVIQMNDPTLDDAMLWGEQRIQEVSRYQASQGNKSLEELFLRTEELNGQIVARRRYQGNGFLAEDVYIVRPQDFIVITLASPQSSFNTFTDDFDRLVSSFTTVN